jgi:hypothetical protein
VEAKAVKDFISWFKRAHFDVDSDKSPQGLVSGRGPEIPGASNNIIKNQPCLLPREWDEKNANHVLILSSEQLGKYMEDERKLKLDDGKTCIDALVESLKKTEQAYRDRSSKEGSAKVDLDVVHSEIRSIQQEYLPLMKGPFHNVLTELAPVQYRNIQETELSLTSSPQHRVVKRQVTSADIRRVLKLEDIADKWRGLCSRRWRESPALQRVLSWDCLQHKSGALGARSFLFGRWKESENEKKRPAKLNNSGSGHD